MIFALKYTCLNEEFLSKKLEERREENAFRRLRLPSGATDFCSNDYLGIASNALIEKRLSSHSVAVQEDPLSGPEQSLDFRALPHGSTGSRLLAGNYPLIEETEKVLASFHQATAGLIFNSGYLQLTCVFRIRNGSLIFSLVLCIAFFFLQKTKY